MISTHVLAKEGRGVTVDSVQFTGGNNQLSRPGDG
jgi:hypothetical protein